MRPGLFVHVMSVEARTRMSYRVDFWIHAFAGFLIHFGMVWFLALALFLESGSDEIRGYTRDGLVFYFAAVLLIERLTRGPEFGGSISEDIYEGGLTRYLLFPVSYVGFKYAQHLGTLLPLVLQAVVFGVIAAFVLDVPEDISLSAGTVLGCGIAALVANLLYFLIRLPLQLVSFWQDNVWSLSIMLRILSALLGGAMIPLAFFPDWSQELLWWLPFRMLFQFPTRTLLGQVSVGEWLGGLGLGLAWCVVFAAIGRGVWKRGDLRYTGVGI